MSGFVFERFTQSLAASDVWRMSMAANELRIAAAAYPVTVSLIRDNRVIGTATMQAGDFVRGVGFTGFHIANGGNAQAVTVILIDGQSGSDRITGEVSVISGEVTRSKSGSAFMAAGTKGNVVAEYACVQLWNPLATGKRLIVNQVVAIAGGAGIWELRRNATAIGTLYTYQQSENKLLGSAIASVAQVRVDGKAAQQGTPVSGFNGGTAAAFVLPINEPLVIEPGNGLIVSPFGTNEMIRASFQYWEESL